MHKMVLGRSKTKLNELNDYNHYTFNTLQINQLITPDPNPKYHKFEVFKNGMEWAVRG